MFSSSKCLRVPGLGLGVLLVLALLVACGGSGSSAGGSADTSAAPKPDPAVTDAAGWLAGQLHNGIATTAYESSGKLVSAPDYGLSLDAFFALEDIEGQGDTRSAILRAVQKHEADYIGVAPATYAGSLGKLLTAEGDAGVAPSSELVSRLEGLVRSHGPEKGRAKDTWAPNDKFGADYSNTIGQSWVVSALSSASSDLTAEAADYLVKQQCHDGFFRESMDSSDFTCDGGTPKQSAPSVDATSFAVEALAALRGTSGTPASLDASLRSAGEWLVSAQAADGSFSAAGAPNANSTGVAATALLATGHQAEAAKADAWLREHQVTSGQARGGLADELGAVAYDDAAMSAGRRDGLTKAVRPQWVRATAQAIPGMTAGADTSGGPSE